MFGKEENWGNHAMSCHLMEQWPIRTETLEPCRHQVNSNKCDAAGAW